MNSKISHKIKHRSNPKDRFYTPIDLVKEELIPLIPLEKDDLVLDPCLGKGAFYDNFPPFVKKEYCEIDLKIDFLTYKSKVDWCVSNPPFSKLDVWFEKTCKICRKGFAYLIGINNFTARRIEMCNNHGFGLTRLHMFKVFKWWGMSCFIIFEKDKENIISYNRKVWREDKNIRINKNNTIDKFI